MVKICIKNRQPLATLSINMANAKRILLRKADIRNGCMKRFTVSEYPLLSSPETVIGCFIVKSDLICLPIACHYPRPSLLDVAFHPSGMTAKWHKQRRMLQLFSAYAVHTKN